MPVKDATTFVPSRFIQHLALPRNLGEGFLRGARHHIGEDGERDDHERAAEGGHADPEMEQEADEDVERHPRQIDERDRSGARQERTHLVEIAQRLQAVTRAAARVSLPTSRPAGRCR